MLLNMVAGLKPESAVKDLLYIPGPVSASIFRASRRPWQIRDVAGTVHWTRSRRPCPHKLHRRRLMRLSGVVQVRIGGIEARGLLPFGIPLPRRSIADSGYHCNVI